MDAAPAGRIVTEQVSLSTEKGGENMPLAQFRNLAVQSYQTIDWNIVYQICSRHLDDFRQFAKAVTTWRAAP